MSASSPSLLLSRLPGSVLGHRKTPFSLRGASVCIGLLAILTPLSPALAGADGANRLGNAAPNANASIPYHPFLDDSMVNSVSVGTVTDGYLVNGAVIPDWGPHHRVGERQRQSGLNRGTLELVDLILDAAAQVGERFPGPPLFVGNLSAPRGGRIPYSISHQSGRDVDFGFYATDLEGNRVFPEDYVRFGRGGRSSCGEYLFDAPRNWALVEALLEQDEAPVQYIFVSRNLRRILLGEAGLQNASTQVLRRARQVLVQPSGNPHADHFHVRISCPSGHGIEGCVDFGPSRSWAIAHRHQVEERKHRIRRLLASSDPEERYKAILLVGLLGDAQSHRRALEMAHDSHPQIRYALAHVMEEASMGRAARKEALGVLVDALSTEPDPVVAQRMLLSIAELALKTEGRGLADGARKGASWRNTVQTVSALLGDNRCLPAHLVPQYLGPFMGPRERLVVSAPVPGSAGDGVYPWGPGGDGAIGPPKEGGSEDLKAGEKGTSAGAHAGKLWTPHCCSGDDCRLGNTIAPSLCELWCDFSPVVQPGDDSNSWASLDVLIDGDLHESPLESPVSVGPQPLSVREAAASALGRLGAQEALAALLQEDNWSHPYFRAVVRYNLSLILNRDLGSSPTPWLQWYSLRGERGGDSSRVALMAEGFVQAGYDVDQEDLFSPRSIGALVDAVAGEAHHSRNAQILLMEFFNSDAPSLQWPKHDAHRHWERTWCRHRLNNSPGPACSPQSPG